MSSGKSFIRLLILKLGLLKGKRKSIYLLIHLVIIWILTGFVLLLKHHRTMSS